MLNKLKNAGINVVVLGVAVLVFVGAFFALIGLAAAQKPPTVTVLAAARNLQIGAVITASDLVEKTVYEDDNTALYIPADQAGEVINGVAALPIYVGQPIFRSSVLAPAGTGVRLSAVLADFPGYSLFPLPLDASNVIAPETASFLPGDLVGITVVIAHRPQPPATPTPDAFSSFIPSPAISTTAQTSPFGQETEKDESESLNRTFPPLAKDLFPMGVRVIAIQGLPQPPAPTGKEGETSDQPVFIGAPQSQMLILLVPNASREALALAMQQGDGVFVTLLAYGDEGVTPGFTYWDFEDLFKADREEALSEGPSATVTPVP